MRDLLDDQANEIEQVLRTHGVGGQVVGGSWSPRLVRFQLRLPPRVKPSRLAPLLGAIAGTLRVQSVRLAPDPETGEAVLEVPRPDPVAVRLLPLAKRVSEMAPPATATLGLDTSGKPLLLRMNALEVSPTLITGSPGAGKSGLLQGMALSLALHNSPETLRLLLIDLSASVRRARHGICAWAGLETLPHLVAEPAHEPQEALLRLRWAARVLQQRAQAADDGKTPEGVVLLVMIDGLEEIVSGPRGGEALDIVRRLARDGRGPNVHLAAATRPSPVVDQMDWGARIVGRCKDVSQAHSASGMQGTGAEALLGEGDFLALLGHDAVRFQAGALRPDEVARTAALLARAAESETASYGPGVIHQSSTFQR